MAKSWTKVDINTKEGIKTGIAPEIISASRSTDIPAFYTDWFFYRLQEGYVKWINPFNQKPQYVSLENTRVVVFWSKDPRPIIDKLHYLEEKSIHYYFQYTLNDYEKEHFERNVPPLEERIRTFQELSTRIGKEKVIWRFDPLILTDRLDEERLLEKVKRVGERIRFYTDKLVFSFADIESYRKVKRNLLREEIRYREFDEKSMKRVAKGIHSINKEWGLELATCSESIDLSEFGISKNKCVDDELLIKLFSDDQRLMDFLGYTPPQISLFERIGNNQPNVKLKDKGQREACGCIISKDVGQYNTCNHQCIYCYANSSQNIVKKNFEKYRRSNRSSETIII